MRELTLAYKTIVQNDNIVVSDYSFCVDYLNLNHCDNLDLKNEYEGLVVI